MVARYRAGLADWARRHGVRLTEDLPERTPNHHIFFLLFPGRAQRDACHGHLRAPGCMATFHYVPLHSSPFGGASGTDAPELPVTDRVAATLLRLPLHPLLDGRRRWTG